MDQEDPHSSSLGEWGNAESFSFDEGTIDYVDFDNDTWTDTPCGSQLSCGQLFIEDAVNKGSVVQSIERGLSVRESRQPYIFDKSADDAMRSVPSDGESPLLTSVRDTDSQHTASGSRIDINSPSSGSCSGSSQQQSSDPCETAQSRRRHDRIEKHYKCTYPNCDAAKDRQSELTKHIKTVHGDKVHVCPECHKGFALGKDLRRHLPTHKKPMNALDLSDDVSSSCCAMSPVSCCSSSRKRVESSSWVHDKSIGSKRYRKSGIMLRRDSPMEVAAATLNAEVSIRPERYSRTRDVSARDKSAITPDEALSSTRQHIDDLRSQFERQSSKHVHSSEHVTLPQKLEFGAVYNDTIIVAGHDLLKTFSSRYNGDSRLKLRMPAGPRDQRQKFLSELQRNATNYATRPMTNIVFVAIDPQSHSAGVVEARRSTKMLSRLIESCSLANEERLDSRAWDTLNAFLQSVLDEHESDFAENCRVCWTRSTAD